MARIVSRAMMRLPIDAWIGTSNIWRGISLRSAGDQLPALGVGVVAVGDHRERVDRLAIHEHVAA